MKRCARCDTVKPLFDFGPNKARKDGLATYCKPCMKAYAAGKGYDAKRWADPESRARETQRHREYRATPPGKAREHEKSRKFREQHPHVVRARNAERKKHVLRATPPWADLDAIREIYEAAQALRPAVGDEVHVDHVIPLRGKNVSGLHVPENLQLRLWRDNLRKSNQFTHPQQQDRPGGRDL